MEAKNLGINPSFNGFNPPVHLDSEILRVLCLCLFLPYGFAHPPLSGIAQSVLWAWNIPLYGS